MYPNLNTGFSFKPVWKQIFVVIKGQTDDGENSTMLSGKGLFLGTLRWLREGAESLSSGEYP